MLPEAACRNAGRWYRRKFHFFADFRLYFSPAGCILWKEKLNCAAAIDRRSVVKPLQKKVFTMNTEEQRCVDLLRLTDYFAFGTLWKIKNRLWQTVIPEFVSKQPDGYHPAVCLGKKNLTALVQVIPMFLGSHSLRKGFPVRDFTAGGSRTGFFQIKPYYFAAAEAVGPQRGIERNDYKPRLTEDEQQRLKSVLVVKGVRFND